MESDTKRIYKYSDKPHKNTPNLIINPQQNIQQQGVPIIIQQQQPYLQPNQIIVSQLQNSVTQPVIYQQLDNQSAIIKPGQQNVIVSNEEFPEYDKSIKLTKRRTSMVCPYCRNLIKTNVELSFNCFKCCIFFLCIILLVWASCSGSCDCGDFCCCCCCCCEKKEEEEPEPADECCTCFHDATHSCPVCKQIIGESTMC